MILEKKSNGHPKEQVRRENVQLCQSEPVTLPTRKGQRQPTPPLLKTSHAQAGTTTSVLPEVPSQSDDLARTLCQRSKVHVIYNPITHTTVQSRCCPPSLGCNPPWAFTLGRREEKRLTGKGNRGNFSWQDERLEAWEENDRTKHCWMSFDMSLALSCLSLDSTSLSGFSLFLYCC